METYLDCIPCLMKQALRAGRAACADETELKNILGKAGDLIKDIPLENTPVETGAVIYKIVRDVTGVYDPYFKQKEKDIKEALELIPELENIIKASDDRLLTAVRIAIAGNVIDLGVDKKFDIVDDIKKILKQDFAVFDFEKLRKKAEKAETILFIGDNCGESVFDNILIKELNKKVFYAVREIPVINDVTYEDAVK
ncbi:MAG: damage-control phosphatase ARMT1 family protein, partial [Thermodesulfobacteriota bacterium]